MSGNQAYGANNVNLLLTFVQYYSDMILDMHMKKVAVLVPCYNEEKTIYAVVSGFKKVLPDADVYVYDNCSSDKTAEEASRAGAIVKYEAKRGKGNVIKSMFRDIDADIYIMVDGDMTYDIKDAPRMVSKLGENGLDMVVAARKKASDMSYPAFHEFGNKMYNVIMKLLFGGRFTDIFSGFRAFSRDFVKSFNVSSEGFDIEAEMTVFAIVEGKKCAEIQSNYYSRPSGSYSKLSSIKDGFRILVKILSMFKEYKLQW